MKKYKNINIIL